MANVSNWKGTEREVAKVFGSTRAPVSNNTTHADVFHNTCYIEVKKRKNFYIWELFEDTKAKALKENKIPVVAIKKKGCKGFLLICRPEDVLQIGLQLTVGDTIEGVPYV